VVTSLRCGTFATTTGSSASSAAARIGSVAFFAPEIRTSPSSGTPPWICSLSMLVLARLFRGERLDRERVDLAAHGVAERAVHELVAGEAALAGELRGDDARGEVGVVVRLHVHLRAAQPGADEARDVFWVHGAILHGRLAGTPIMTRMDSHAAAAADPGASISDEQLLTSARRALAVEARALAGLAPRLSAQFVAA